MIEYDFTMTFEDGCLLDQLSSSSIIEGFNYYIAATGLKQIPAPTFVQQVANCPIEWSLITIEKDKRNELKLSDTYKKFIKLHSTGQIDIDVGDNYNVVDQVWSFKLKATSTLSTMNPGNMVEYDFTMNLVDGCTIDKLSSLSTISNFNFYIDKMPIYKHV